MCGAGSRLANLWALVTAGFVIDGVFSWLSESLSASEGF